MAERSTPPSRDIREQHYRLLQVGKRELRMDEDSYRELLRRHGAELKDGKYSASTMPVVGLMHAVGEMREKGFTPKKGGADWRTPQIEKIQAIWEVLYLHHIVKNPQAVAMERWCARVTGKAKLEWCTANDLSKCIEGLKSWAKRMGLTDAIK